MTSHATDPCALLLPAPKRIERLGGVSEFAREYSYCDQRDLAGPIPEAGSGAEGVVGGVIGAMLERLPSSHFTAGIELDRANASIIVARDPARAAQHYRLTVRAGTATIEASDRAGGVYGVATLGQLAALTRGRIPNCVISDGPDYPVRGFMLDVSRNRVPTMDSLADLVVLLARLKINHLELYTEHTFAYAGHEDVWRDWSPITPDEMRELARLCGSFAIDLCPNQNTLGHLAPWFAHQKYADLAETHGEWTFEFEDRRITRHGPFSLCPTDPRALELVRDLLGQLAPCTRGPFVNIGCDEAYDIGSGRSREQVAQRGRGAVYMDHLMGVCEIARALGRTPMYWGDIVLHSDAAIERIARSPMRNAVALVWGYEGDSPFAAQTQRLQRAGVPHWVCPGTSSWRSIVGRGGVSGQNIANALAAGRASGATAAGGWSGSGGGLPCGGASAGTAGGALLTDWGDLGHRQQWVVSMVPLAHFAAGAWNGGAPIEDSAIARTLWGEHGGAVFRILDDLWRADEPLRRTMQRGRLRNAGAFFTDLHRPLSDDPGDAAVWGEPGAWREALARLRTLEGAVHALPGSVDRFDRAGCTRAQIAHTWRVALHAAERAVLSRAHVYGRWTREDAARLHDDMRAIIEEHRALWLAVSRPGGLEASTAHYQRTLAEYDAAAGR